MATNNASNTYIVPTANNEVTMPSQPAFLAYNSVTDANVTGHGALYTVIFETEVFDQNADYNNATGTFTAPVTGRYRVNTCVSMLQTAGTTTWALRFIASNREWRIFHVPGADGTSHNGALIDMDAADIVIVTITLTGIGANTADVYGGADAHTSFGGFLAV